MCEVMSKRLWTTVHPRRSLACATWTTGCAVVNGERYSLIVRGHDVLLCAADRWFSLFDTNGKAFWEQSSFNPGAFLLFLILCGVTSTNMSRLASCMPSELLPKAGYICFPLWPEHEWAHNIGQKKTCCDRGTRRDTKIVLLVCPLASFSLVKMMPSNFGINTQDRCCPVLTFYAVTGIN